MSTVVKHKAEFSAAGKRALLDQLLREKASAPKPFPLSFAQQRLWFMELMVPGTGVYNLSRAIRMRGDLDMTVLQQAVETLVARHESLRTTFGVFDGSPVQLIAEHGLVSMPVIDLSDRPDTHREDEVMRLVTEEVRHPFDLTQGPLFRTTVLRVGEVEHVFILTIHHIVSDGGSMGILLREIAALYNAYLAGKPSPLSPLPLQYADFSCGQREWLSGEVLERQLTYWRRQLGGSLPVLELPIGRSRPAVQTYRGARRSLLLTKSLTDALKRLSQGERVTLFMTLLGAFKTLLFRYIGQSDLIVGSPISGRNSREIEGLIGLFVNNLVLRTDMSGDPSFRSLLRRVREVALGAYAHQDLPFEKLVEELQPARGLSHSPLFQVSFVFQSEPRQPMELSNLKLDLLEVDNGTSMYDVTLFLWAEAGGVVGRLEYNTDLFEGASIDRMIGHYQTLLEGIVADPERRLSELPLLSEAEQRRLLVEWNATRVDYPLDSCLHQLLEAQVERSPEAVAVAFEDQRLTYGELNQRANQLAHHLRRLGVGPEVLVGVFMERSLEMVIGLYGILKAGGAYVPIDPDYPAERIGFMVQDSQVPVLLTQQRLVERLPEHKARLIRLDSEWPAIATESGANLHCGVKAENLAYVIYTSGSTGRPKGAMNTHRGICNRLLSMQETYCLTDSDIMLQKTPFSFDVSVWEFFWPLLAGARLVVARPEGHKDSAYLAELIVAQGITTLHFVPSMLQIFLQEPQVEACKSLKRVFCGGESLSYDLQERFFQCLSARLHNLYGPTEAAVDVTFWECQRRAPERLVPIGRPVANTQMYILDTHLQPVPMGVAGELHIGGVQVGRGYLNRPELTAEKFIKDPFSEDPNARLYKTGDLARYLPDAAIEYLGRLDHQVKIRGFRIELGEIEAVLRQNPGVQEAVLIAWENVPSDKRLVAYLVATQEPPPSTHELRKFLKEKLPEYMVPFVFIFIDTLPLSPNGKVDRRALPAPDQVRVDLGETLMAPRDMLEIQLTKIWEQILGRSPIGIRDNFFEVGGHSLLAVQLMHQVQEVVGKNLPVIALFQAPTIEQQANILRQEGWSSPWSSLVPIQPHGSKPPFFFVAASRYHFDDRLGPDQPVYRLQMQNFEQPLTRAEDMAAYCIKDMRSLQPEGPYFLGGHCFGGVVAFEMAQQLRTQGQQVALLALFDCYVPGSIRVLANTSLASRLWRRFAYHGDKLLQVGAKEEFAHVMRGVRRKTREMVWRQAWKIRPQTGELLIKTLKDPRAKAANYKARKSYVPQVYPGRVILFRSTDRGAWKHYDPENGWGNLAMAGVEIHEIPGSHAGMYQEPNVRIVVRSLRACLERAQSGAEP